MSTRTIPTHPHARSSRTVATHLHAGVDSVFTLYALFSVVPLSYKSLMHVHAVRGCVDVLLYTCAFGCAYVCVCVCVCVFVCACVWG